MNPQESAKPEVDSPIRELINQLYDVAATSTPTTAEAVGDSPVHQIQVRMKPDPDGRFGFNVKGGHDQNCPVLVSRVAPNTPADNALPTRLHEGDQVVAINGTEVAGLRHEQVVQLIRSTKDQGPEAELVLTIRPNLFHQSNGGGDAQCGELEPPFQYTVVRERSIQNLDLTKEAKVEIDAETIHSPLGISMNLLQEGLDSDSLIIQFEVI